MEIINQITDPSERGAVSELRQQLSKATLACPNSTFVLGGYSFGAMTIQHYLHLPLGHPSDADLTNVRSRIAAVMLYGDPTWPLQQDGRQGFATSANLGYTTETYIPQDMEGKVKSLCLSYDAPYTIYDPICSFHDINEDVSFLHFVNCLTGAQTDTIVCPHLRYVETGATKIGADFLAGKTGVKAPSGVPYRRWTGR